MNTNHGTPPPPTPPEHPGPRQTGGAPAKPRRAGNAAAPSRYLRSTTARAPAGNGANPTVDRETETIRGYSVITRGEANGHALWVDAEFLGSVAAAINARPAGVKSRFTHPELSGDGLGTYLGRTRNAEIAGNRVIADLHLAQAAHESPDGDLAGYVMQLAEDDPAAFGASIVFAADTAAMEQFTAEHTDAEGQFRSPDPENANNYPHARLAADGLRAADMVDNPAANPDGLFHRGAALADEARALAGYALGLETEAPELVTLELDPERIRGFVARFLAAHNLEIKARQEEPPQMDQNTQKPPEGPSPSPPTSPAELAEATRAGQQRELDRFSELAKRYADDPSFIVAQFAEGHNAEQAEAAYKDRVIAKLRAELDEAKHAGERPAKFRADSPAGSDSDFIATAAALATEKRVPLHIAMSELARTNRELYQRNKGEGRA